MRFYSSYTNRRGTDCGAAPRDGSAVHTRGWNAGVRVYPGADEGTGADEFAVFMTTGSHGAGGHDVCIGTVQDTPAGPVFIPAGAQAAE